VTSSPAGINCGGDCSESYVSGTMVTLTAAVANGATFTSWSGAAGCTTATTCIVTVTAAQTVTATFAAAPTFALTVTKAGAGAANGTVTSSPAGINCGVDCTETYVGGTMVTLTAAVANGATFTGWSGAGAGTCTTATMCVVTMDAAKSITATFGQTFALLVSVAGPASSGTVTSAPAGINCPGDCNETYDSTQMVVLTATPAVGSTFTGWSGDCAGTMPMCTVTMNAARNATATFTTP
jgi:trimeric autotransporter adhesin